MFYEPDNLEYISGRLNGTVVRTKENDPFLIEYVGKIDGKKKYFTDGVNVAEGGRDQLYLEDLKLESPRLGFTNYDGNAIYLGRFPMRRDWKQGLRSNNMFVWTKSTGITRYPFSIYRPLIVPFKHQYPSYKEAVLRIEDIFTSVAFSPHFSIDTEGKIYYKTYGIVGHDQKGQPKLYDDFFWLKEALEEVMK